MNNEKEIEIFGVEIKVWMENSTMEFTICDEDPVWIKKAFRTFLAEYLRNISAKTDPM